MSRAREADSHTTAWPPALTWAAASRENRALKERTIGRVTESAGIGDAITLNDGHAGLQIAVRSPHLLQPGYGHAIPPLVHRSRAKLFNIWARLKVGTDCVAECAGAMAVHQKDDAVR